MLCQNCGKNEANVRYTQIINGVKKEMIFCEVCSKKLGIGDFNFNMPINLSSFLSEFIEDSENEFLPSFTKIKKTTCQGCGMTFDDFINIGKFGCDNCYHTFSEKIDPILKNLHGDNRHIGRKGRVIQSKSSGKLENKEEEKKIPEQVGKEVIKLEELKKQLKEVIKEERYEEAAKIRDEIKKIENKN